MSNPSDWALTRARKFVREEILIEGWTDELVALLLDEVKKEVLAEDKYQRNICKKCGMYHPDGTCYDT